MINPNNYELYTRYINDDILSTRDFIEKLMLYSRGIGMNFKLYYLDKESLEIKFIDLFANPPSRFPEKTIKLLVADNKL